MKDNNELFDQMIRDSLLEAEEKAPSFVWKNVSGRLSSGTSFDWRHASMVMAAAALCACLVLVGTFVRRSGEQPQAVAQQVKLVPPPVAERQAILADVSSANTEEKDVFSKEPGFASLSASAKVTDSTVKKTADSSSSSTEDILYDEGIPESTGGSKVSGQEKQKETTSVAKWEDPFSDEQIVNKDEHKVSLDLKGAFSANRSSIQFGSTGIQGAPAYISGGIEDISESSYGLPFTVGVGVRWYLSKRFSLGTGVDYSLLTRKFTGNYYPKDGTSIIMLNADVFHSLSYIGIPVNAYYDIIQHSLVGLYVFGGAEVERAVANSYRISNSTLTQYYNEAVSGCQYSAQLGLGVEFMLTDFMGIYFDPCLKFYFNKDQPTSMRTQQPLMFSAALGLKFNILKK